MTGALRSPRPDIDEYARLYQSTPELEPELVRLRHALIVERLLTHGPATVVEVGCGADPLFGAVRNSERLLDSLSAWVTVEPGRDFAEMARGAGTGIAGFSVIRAFVEDAVRPILGLCGEPDVIICASLLHEVPDPVNLLSALRRLAAPNTVLHVNVPNAYSLHRRLARAMGLIPDEHHLGTRNRMLGQPRVFDRASLTDLLTEHGFTVVAAGGLFLKPFTHAQMVQLPFLTDQMLEGLDRLGRELPELAAEIWLECHPTETVG